MYQTYFPDNPFSYYFLEDIYRDHYYSDQQVGNLGTLFSILAVIIACLGLLGITSLNAVHRTKEIGIRKVLGATSSNIFYRLSLEFVVLIALSGIVFTPIGVYLSDFWLQGFSFQHDPQFWHYLIPAVLLMVISLASVSYYTLKAAVSNPVKALRYE